jgi:hypothetical protein
LFHIYFQDTKETYVKLDLDYVLKYSLDIPLEYHELKAEYIVRKAREARTRTNDSYYTLEESRSKELEHAEVAVYHSTKRQRGESAPVKISLRKQKEAVSFKNLT